MYKENDLLFPNSAIPILSDFRDERWKELVTRACASPDDHPVKLAFVLMMMRYSGCTECETDSYRAMKGCDNCALQTMRRFKGTDEELHDAFERAMGDIEAFFRDAQIA